MLGRWLCLLSVVVAAASVVEPSHALSLYASIQTGTHAGEIWLVDPVNGHQLVGRPVTPDLSGLAADSNGTLYASTFGGVSGSSLIRIDPQDGSLLGSVPIVDSLGAPMSVTDLAMQPGSDVLYATTVIDPGIENQKLYSIDLSTGVATLVGDTGVQSWGGGPIAFAPDGTLYYADWTYFIDELRLYRLDPVTGYRIGASLLYAGGDDGMAVGPDGMIYGSEGSAVRKVDPDVEYSVISYALLGPVGTIGDLAFVAEPSLLALLGAGLALAAAARRTGRA